MGKDFKIKETQPECIKRWIATSKDAFGIFTGVPNKTPIYHRLTYYGEHIREKISKSRKD